jgi:thiamine-phosphate pyrophosphorylase
MSGDASAPGPIAVPAAPPVDRAARLARLRGLYAIVGEVDPVDRAEAALAGGAGAIQVRMKRSPAGDVLDAVRRIVERARGRAIVIVNDRADLALLAGADGVHVGDEDLPPAEVRRLVGPSMLVGRTCRTLADARAAIAEGADHVGYGPIFASRSKPLAVAPRGLDGLRQVAAGLAAPVVAISGITLETVAEVAAAGAAAAAVIEDLFERGDVRTRAAALAARFEEGERARAGRG